MARTKRKELEKEAKRKGELSQKNPNVEKSVAAKPLLLPQNSSNCAGSAVKFDSSLGQSLSLPKRWEVPKHKAVVAQTESHVSNKEYHQLPSKDGTLCNRGGEATKLEQVSSLQALHPHAPLSTLQKLNICDDGFMSESVGDSRPLTDSGGKVGNIKKSQSMTVTSSKRVLFPASLSSPSQLPRAVVCVEDICKSPDGNILKIMKRQSSKEPTETEGASCSFEQNFIEFSDLLVKNSATDLSLTGDRTVSSTSTSKNIFEQFDTEIIGRRSPRLRSNSPRGNYSQGSPVFQDMSSRSNSEERQHSNIVSAVRALRGISEKVSEVRSQTRVRNQESKLVSLVISDSKEASPESLSPQRHSPRGSADMNPPELAIKTPKGKKTPPSPAAVENCETSPSGVKRGRSPRSLSDDIPSPQVSSQKFDNRDEECMSISSPCRKKPKMDDGASENAVPSFQILSSTSVPAHLPFKGMLSEPQATSSLKTSEQVCLNADLHTKDSGARKVCSKSGYSRSFRIISSTSPQGHLSSKGIQRDRDPRVPSSFATSDQVCLSADSHSKDLGVKKTACANPGEEEIVTHSLSSQLYPQSQISGAVECAEGMEPSLLCAMLIGGSEVAKTYEQSREHANVPSMSRQQEPVALSSSSNSVVDALLNGELTMDHPTPYELPLLSRLPPLVKPDFGVLDLTLNEPVSFEEENVFVYKKNVVLLALISKVTDYLKQLGTAVDGSVIEDAEKALFEDGSEQKQLPFRTETPVIASEQMQGMTSGQSDFKLNCDAHNKNLLQETRCENLTADSSINSPVNIIAINGVDENSGIDSGKKNSAEAHQPITEQMQGSVQDKPDDDLAHINERTAESSLASEKQKSLGELDTVVAKGTNQTAPQMLLVLPSSNKDLIKAVEKNKNVSDLNTFVDQSTTSGTSEPVGEPDKIFPESNSTTTTSSREVKSGEISEDPGILRPQWQPKVPSGSHTGRPLWSRWHKIVLPSPIHILSRPEQPSVNKRLSPFISKELDAYLRKHSNRLIVPAGPKSKLAKILVLHGFFKDNSHLESELNRHSNSGHCSGDDCPGRSDEDEEGDDEERDDFPQKFEPDFDEVDGLVFMSFANETAMESHIQVEKDLKWDKEPNAFLNIARFRAFEESRREDGTSRRESQGLRGQHMRWRKYQRMYRKEFRGRLEAKEKGLPWPLPRIPHKTSDVSKIKNWKRKLERDGIKTEDASGSQNPVCAGSDAASHKKKKRKTYVFSVKKKSKKSAPAAERVFNLSIVSDHDVDDHSVEGAKCPSDVRSAEEEDDYGKPIPIDQDGYMEDVQNSLKEMEQKQKGIMLNKTLLSHLRMGPEDCEIFKKLGGWVTCQKPIKKGSGDKKSKNQTISSVTTGDIGNEKKTQKKSKASFILDRVREERAREAVLAIQRYDDVRDAHSSLQFSSDSNDMSVLSEGGDFMDLTGDSPSPTSSHKAKYSCDKPGCRYGCICHLCQSIGESDDLEQGLSATSQGRACDKEYCRLGCICESLEKSSKRSSPLHCRKPECVLECQCLKEVPGTSENPHPLVKAEADAVEKNLHIELKSEKMDPVDLAESSGDELPTLEKTNSRRQRSLDRYSNLPRRQTSYRIAKNLDAVSRKAMMLYETSEIYWEQSCNRRKKSADSPGSSAAVPFTASNTVSTYCDTIPITSDPCTSPPAATTLTLLSPFSRQGLTHAATAEHSQASIPVSIACVTTSSGMTPVPTSSKSQSTLGSGAFGQNHQKANQELSPVVISDDEGHANKTSSIQNQLDSPKSTKIKLSEPNTASCSTQKSSSLTATSTQLASTPPVASVASGTSLTGLISSAFSQPRWHTSMVCLRANPPGKEKKDTSDDVQEEDEIKLLEFIANCNWDSAKKNILLQVAQCLSRAQYPSPRTMFVGDFRVEILPKASKPSVIPPELRSKLPEMMYSIRVRVTPYRNASTPSPHPVGLFRNAATPAGVSVVPVPTGVIPLAVSTHPRSPNKPDDLREKFNQSSFGISGLGQLQINHNTSPSSLSLQGESIQLQGKKTKKRGNPDSTDSQQSGKKKRKKEKKKKVDVERSSNRAADTKNKKESSPGSTPGAIKVPIMGTTQSFPISKLMPLIPGVSSHQVIGPVANLKDLKFIQLPGQKSLLQLLPASALGIKPSPDGKGSPQFLAVPVPIAPVPVKGDSKRGGNKMQVDNVASAHAFSGGAQNSTQPVGGPVQLSVLLQTSSTADSNISSKKKKKKKKKKKEEDVKTSRNSASICRSGSTTTTAMPASDTSSVSVPSGFQEQSAPDSLPVVPNVGSPVSRLEGVTVGLKTPPPISSVLFGNQIISITSPGRQSATGGEQAIVATKAKPDLTLTPGCRDSSKVAPEKTVSLLANSKSLLSTTPRILSSTSPGGLEGSAGEKVPPAVNLSQKSAPAFADDYLTQLKTKTSKAKKKNQLLLASPKQNRSPEKGGMFVDEDSLASVGSQGSGSSNSLFFSEEDSADLEQENQMSGESNLVSEQTLLLTPPREREKCIVPRIKNKSRVHLVHKQREKNRRAEHYQMFQHLKNILFSIDPDRRLLPPLPKSKLLSKAELVVKYHSKRSQSLEKTYAVEQKRHALLKQQLDTKIDDLKQDGAAEEIIMSILDSLNVSHPPRVPLDNHLSMEEQILLASDNAAVSTSSNRSAAVSDSHSSYNTRLRSGSVASMLLSPWHVDHIARSVVSSEESNASQPVSITSSTSRSASPASSQPKEKRRKSCKPVKLKSKLSSQFVIEIERADEDVGFMDSENNDCRVEQTQEDADSFAINDTEEPSGGLKQTLQQRSSTFLTADARGAGDTLEDGDAGLKVMPSDHGSMSTHGVQQEQTGEDAAKSDTVNLNLDSNPYVEASGKGCPHDFLPAADVDSDVQ